MIAFHSVLIVLMHNINSLRTTLVHEQIMYRARGLCNS